MRQACTIRIAVSLLFAALFVGASPAKADAAEFPGKTSDWNGFTRYDFTVDDRPVLVVTPKKPAEGNPWVWHGEFFGHKPAPDVELLKRGFHIVYMRVPDMLGSPGAVAHWNVLYRELTEGYGLAAKVALVGLSRGGLYCYNWAIANPGKVACIYGNAPVCDFKSWPGGRGKGKGSPRDWKLVLEQYGFRNDDEALAYDGNPIDRLKPLAEADVPLLHVFGDADDVVPWDENTKIIADRYRKLGGRIWLIEKPGIGHHPHSLDDPTPIVEFIYRHTLNLPWAVLRKNADHLDKLSVEIEPSKQVVYKKVDSRELYLHVFEPEGLQPGDQRPCFVAIHSGGWGHGTPRRYYPYANHFAKLGMLGISVQYRLYDPKQGTTVFDCVKDGRSAVRFIRSHAGLLGVDPNKIVVAGASAGGHLAAGTALFDGVDDETDDLAVSCTPNALVLICPVIDTSAEGYGQRAIGERWRELSPAHQVDGKKVPPTLVFHGTGDTTTPIAGAKAFQQAMIAAGNRCELVTHEGGQHGYMHKERELYQQTLKKTQAFLRELDLLP